MPRDGGTIIHGAAPRSCNNDRGNMHTPTKPFGDTLSAPHCPRNRSAPHLPHIPARTTLLTPPSLDFSDAIVPARELQHNPRSFVLTPRMPVAVDGLQRACSLPMPQRIASSWTKCRLRRTRITPMRAVAAACLLRPGNLLPWPRLDPLPLAPSRRLRSRALVGQAALSKTPSSARNSTDGARW